MHLQFFPGPSLFSAVKQTVLLQQIQKLKPDVCNVESFYIHLVKYRQDVNNNAEYMKSIGSLLDYGDDFSSPYARKTAADPDASLDKNNVLYVLPRPGSISPWSSKATDIAAICNLGSVVERIERGAVFVFSTSSGIVLKPSDVEVFQHLVYDRMTQVIRVHSLDQQAILHDYFSHRPPTPLAYVELIGSSEINPSNRLEVARNNILSANKTLGLALADDEIAYLLDAYISGSSAMSRNPTDAELFMFAQVNSEHCRHKIFNAAWTVDSVAKPNSLFQMIRNTEKVINGAHTISAYSDNAAVLEGYVAPRFYLAPGSNGLYQSKVEAMPLLIKVETHNHPTAVSPYPGAATGSGGEIRDEGAVGRGSHPKAGLSGFTVSNLLIPGYKQPWETDFGYPSHIASALDIMIEAPLGAAAFNNEFGRPALAGYWRTFSENVPTGPNGTLETRGYHKPIMIAGGVGNVRPKYSKKPWNAIKVGAPIVVLGGPGLLIGLGGGAASSQTSGSGSAELDFASVQRDNAEMQRRCQQVIDACTDHDNISGDKNDNPILSIHDVGAGGLSNALPELVHDSGLGATFEIRDVLVADSALSPMEIWCNESQERYVLAISPLPGALEAFEKIAKRERCPYSVVGLATEAQELIVTDRLFGKDVIRLRMETLFGKPPKMTRQDISRSLLLQPFDSSLKTYITPTTTPLDDAIDRVLRLPSVGSKAFLITIGDRSITGLVARDQMVGPWQVPVSDVAVTRTTYGFNVITGEAMAMGERTPLALLNAAASARMAVAESLTNLAAAYVEDISRVKLSANWMCAASKQGEGAALYEAVESIGLSLCPALGVGIPVGKDSMSMSMKWKDNHIQKEVTAPLSLIVTAFAPVADIALTWTPQIRGDIEENILIFFDLANGKQRLGGSCLAQVYKQLGHEAPNVEDPAVLRSFFTSCNTLKRQYPSIVLAYHDRSDGGLFTTLSEMTFAGRIGIEADISALVSNRDTVACLFNEELGAVMQIRAADFTTLVSVFSAEGFPSRAIHKIGRVQPVGEATFTIIHDSQCIFSRTRASLQQAWAETSFRMQCIRDDPQAAEEEYSAIMLNDSGLFYDLRFTVDPLLSRHLTARPMVAILREQGTNGHVEMAWAFTQAGFAAIDVHMSDIISGTVSLSDFRGLAICGGFSYGDVLGAANGWASSVRWNTTAREEFARFFLREDTFTLAVCNGCQFLSRLRTLLPGTDSWPIFKPNRSGFEARVSMVEIVDNAVTRVSVFLRDMAGSRLPIAVAHGEGRATFSTEEDLVDVTRQGLVALRYVDDKGRVATSYPANPNGSPEGIAGVQTRNGRFLALMPHPERVVTLESNSWYPPEVSQQWGRSGPWFRIFQNARIWCG
ncbi:CobB/CobQ-like glutamine amidotransferase domain-containing protein [Hysterangium stoloniferum]|nr:CobB/CobQ-like glutamine amidotransferase domain-containing protein [Hysterangium stoloniferum]